MGVEPAGLPDRGSHFENDIESGHSG